MEFFSEENFVKQTVESEIMKDSRNILDDLPIVAGSLLTLLVLLLSIIVFILVKIYQKKTSEPYQDVYQQVVDDVNYCDFYTSKAKYQIEPTYEEPIISKYFQPKEEETPVYAIPSKLRSINVSESSVDTVLTHLEEGCVDTLPIYKGSKSDWGNEEEFMKQQYKEPFYVNLMK